MKSPLCGACGAQMKKNGKTKDGAQRFRCKACGSSFTHRINSDAKALKEFVEWLLSRNKQIDMPGNGRTFRRRTSKFWALWPLPDVVDEIHRVIYVDGLYLARNVVILIAASDDYVLSWYLTRSENSHAWEALLSRIAPPDIVITDGGVGFAKAVKRVWPDTVVQRCIFHVFNQVKRCTTTRPKLLAGKEIYQLSKELLHIKTLKQAQWWTEQYLQWCEFWSEFLSEYTYVDGRKEYTHERLRQARRALTGLVNKNLLFAYLDPRLNTEEPMPSMNNRIENINGRIRSVLRDHRGLSLLRRIKAVYWWCYMHTEYPSSYAQILKTMPTDKDIDVLYETYKSTPSTGREPVEWGEGVVWNELHHKTEYPFAID